MAKCNFCNGEGEKFILPRGNPFNMRLPQLAQAMVKVKCARCGGTGEKWQSQYADDEVYR